MKRYVIKNTDGTLGGLGDDALGDSHFFKHYGVLVFVCGPIPCRLVSFNVFSWGGDDNSIGLERYVLVAVAVIGLVFSLRTTE